MKNRDFDRLISSYVDESSRNIKATRINLADLHLSVSALKSFASFFENTETKIRFKPRATQMSANRILAVLRNANPNIDIEYSDELDENNELVHKSSKPLWVLSKDASGTFSLTKAPR